MNERPSVGVAVIVVKDEIILVGRDGRKGDVWGVPGGHRENGELKRNVASAKY
jgi:ADP-ribose pyrophosphatase YjhB (NUDIX family)